MLAHMLPHYQMFGSSPELVCYWYEHPLLSLCRRKERGRGRERGSGRLGEREGEEVHVRKRGIEGGGGRGREGIEGREGREGEGGKGGRREGEEVRRKAVNTFQKVAMNGTPFG